MAWTCPCCGHHEPKWIDPLVAVNSLKMRGERKKMLVLLAEHFGEWLTSERIAGVIFADRNDGGPLYTKCRVGMLKCQMSPMLADYGLKLEGHQAVGYRMVQRLNPNG